MLEVNNVSKVFSKDEKPVIEKINLKLNKGEIVGLIGSNGAGKTTLMKMIVKTKKPTSGDIYIDGENIFKKDNVLKNVGIAIDTVYFPHLSAKENIKFYLNVNNLKHYYKNIERVLEIVDLKKAGDKKAKDFSFGMKQRLSIAICLVAEPKLAIMDEPFVGLDPNGVNTLIKALKEWAEKNKMSILISSHQLNELEEVCSRFVFLKNGLLEEANYTKNRYLEVHFKEKIEKNDREYLKKQFNTINYINENIIQLENNSDELNDIINYMLPKYTLLKTDINNKNLYTYFDEKERD